MQIQYDFDKKGIGERLKLERERAGYTQESMAEAMGITAKYISKVETGSSAPSLAYIMMFSDIAGSDCGYLLQGVYRSGDEYAGAIKEPAILYGDPPARLSKKRRKICNEMMSKIIEVLENNNI